MTGHIKHRAWQIQVSATCPAFHSILKMAQNFNILYIFYTFFWASEIKNHLPSQNLDLSRAAGQWICQALKQKSHLTVVWAKKKSHNHHFVQTAGRLSTVMLKFNIYVKVSILNNYKTKQPSNLAWNISLTSWLCDIGIRFSIHPSVCWSIRLSTFMSKFDIYDKVSILKYSNQLQD